MRWEHGMFQALDDMMHPGALGCVRNALPQQRAALAQHSCRCVALRIFVSLCWRLVPNGFIREGRCSPFALSLLQQVNTTSLLQKHRDICSTARRPGRSTRMCLGGR